MADPDHKNEAHDPIDDSRMSFTEHLRELRTRIIRAGIALVVCALICYAFGNKLLEIMAYPIAPLNLTEVQEVAVAEAPAEGGSTDAVSLVPQVDPEGKAEPKRKIEWVLLNFIEIILVRIKLAGYGGFLLAMPIILYQACAFVFPGLRPGEKRAVKVIIFGCGGLACAGVAVAYWGVFPVVVPYLMHYWVPEGMSMQLRVNENLSLIIKGLAGFAIAFQFPMIVLVLVYMGILEPATLRKYRKVAIVGLAVAAAVFTPPDPITMIIMMLPLCLLYEGSIWVAYLVVRRRKTAEAGT